MERFETWVERQIREATERGEFDNLPGEGQPIPGLNGRDDEDWWVKGFLEREKLPMPLPPSLALRREVAGLRESLARCATKTPCGRSSPISIIGSSTPTDDASKVRR